MQSVRQWIHLPKIFGDDNTAHRCVHHWSQNVIFEELWAVLLLECDELNGVNWKWQSADGSLGKSRFGSGETDRGKADTKKSIVDEEQEGPLGIVIAPANSHVPSAWRKP